MRDLCTFSGVLWLILGVSLEFLPAPLSAQDEPEDLCVRFLSECEEGHAEACVLGGNRLLTRDWECAEVTDRVSRATGAYQRACELSLAEGCTALAEIRGSGLHAPANAEASAEAYERALTLLRRDCDRREWQGCTGVADLIDRGHVRGTRDQADAAFKRGVALLRDSCENGSGEACVLAGRILNHAGGGRSDPGALARLWERGCQLGEGSACYSLAQHDASAPRSRVRELHGRGCTLGMASSCIALAEREKLEGNWPRAAEYLDRACFLGLCGACHELAGLFETGKAAPPHDGRATESRKVECPYLIGPEK